MIGFIAILLSASQTAEPPRAPAPPAPGSTYVLPKVTCPPSPEDTQRLLALSFHDFDQNPLSGWRLYGSNGCYMDGARLIDAYADKITDARLLSGLRFHQFQMLAHAGDTPAALTVLREVKRLDVKRNADTGWKLYVAGTEAFLESRKSDLEEHRAALVAFADQHGPTERAARANAKVLMGLVQCFGKPYRQAYQPSCAHGGAGNVSGPAAVGRSGTPSNGELAAAPVVNAVREALTAEAALPPASSAREKLERMGILDQAGRAHIHKIDWSKLSPEERKDAGNAMAAAIDPVDEANLAELRKLLPKQGWFTRREYGEKATDAAFHILQHSDDTELKKRLLPYIQAAALAGEIDGADFAAMFDRIATSEGRPQRYGTQFRCVDGRNEPFPLEDPTAVERLRAELKLRQTFAEYQQRHSNRPCAGGQRSTDRPPSTR
jgi:hypothetical protein